MSWRNIKDSSMCSAIITKSNSFEGIKYAESFFYLFSPKRRQLFVKLTKEHSTDIKLWPKLILNNTFSIQIWRIQDIIFFGGRKWQMKAILAVLQLRKTFPKKWKTNQINRNLHSFLIFLGSWWIENINLLFLIH